MKPRLVYLRFVNISFSKYHGTGNDFILIDNRAGNIDLSLEQIRFLCDRHLGVGADGLILLESHRDLDFFMNYYNSDGSQSFCGNGSRCAVAFFRRLTGVTGKLSFEAIDGIHEAKLVAEEHCISMRNAQHPEVIDEGHFIDTGSPHVVIEVSQLHDLDVCREGAAVRYNERWSSRGVNVNFIERTEALIHVRTYERGVENETLSCGTGVTAVALIDGFLHGGYKRRLQTQGGVLTVRWDSSENGFENIELQGPAELVFNGVVDLDQ